MLAELPFSWVLPAAFFVVLYPLAWLPPTALASCFGVILLNVEVSASLGSLIAASLFDSSKAITVAICYMCFCMCAGGYFVNLANVPQWVGYLRYASFWYYSLALFTSNALPTDGDREAFDKAGTLDHYSFSSWSFDGHPEWDVLVLLGFAVVHRVGAYSALCTSSKLRFR